MSKKLLISSLILLSLVLSACSTPWSNPGTGSGDTTLSDGKKLTTIEEHTADWQSYGDDKTALTFKYPSDWAAKVRDEQVTFSFGRGEEVSFTVEELDLPHPEFSDLAKTEKGEKWHYNKYASKGKNFFNVFKEFNPSNNRTFMNGTVFYSPENYLLGEAQKNLTAYRVDFEMKALDLSLTEAKEILKDAKYKDFWNVLNTLKVND